VFELRMSVPLTHWQEVAHTSSTLRILWELTAGAHMLISLAACSMGIRSEAGYKARLAMR